MQISCHVTFEITLDLSHLPPVPPLDRPRARGEVENADRWARRLFLDSRSTSLGLGPLTFVYSRRRK